MGEQEPQIPIGTEVDPTKLIVQDGEDIGRIADAERTVGTIDVVSLPEEFKEANGLVDGNTVEKSNAYIEGLPLVGATAEDQKRSEIADIQPDKDGTADQKTLHNLVYNAEGNYTGLDNGEAKDKIADMAGESAMITEIGNRAAALVEGASDDLVKQVREAAEAAFKAELDSKKAEKQKIADDKAREVLAKIQGGAKIDEVLPQSAQPATETAWNSTDSRNIGLSLGGEDSMPNGGGGTTETTYETSLPELAEELGSSGQQPQPSLT